MGQRSKPALQMIVKKIGTHTIVVQILIWGGTSAKLMAPPNPLLAAVNHRMPARLAPGGRFTIVKALLMDMQSLYWRHTPRPSS